MNGRDIMGPLLLDVRDLRFSYHRGPEVLRGVSFSVSAGDLVSVLGSNGVGKSTLFRCMLGFLPKFEGAIEAGGKDIRSMSRRELARAVAYVPQSSAPVFDYTLKELVLMGMTNSMRATGAPSKAHEQRALEVLEELGIAQLAERGCAQVSGGQRQLALLARALVQDARVLVMDEPTANLDYGNQYRVMERIGSLAGRGFAIVMSTHDPNQALCHANRVIALDAGTVVADGKPSEVMTESLLARLYDVPVTRGELQRGKRTIEFCMPGGDEA